MLDDHNSDSRPESEHRFGHLDTFADSCGSLPAPQESAISALMSARSLQSALELAHYGRKHRGATFVVALGFGLKVDRFLLDFKLAEAFALRVVVVAERHPAGEALLQDAIAAGVAFELLDGPDPQGQPGVSGDLLNRVEAILQRGGLPVILVPAGPANRVSRPVKRVAGDLANSLRAKRLFVVAPRSSMPEFDILGPHLTQPEVDAVAQRLDAPFWRYVAEMTRSAIAAIVALPAQAGCLFEELFSHGGAGILVGDPLIEEVRQATLRDVGDIELLLRSEIEQGFVRPINAGEAARTANDHLVYTIDGVVVGTARLAPHQSWAEMSRFATLPRYRGRGRARSLGEGLLRHAARLGFTDLFALSVDARMWKFFVSLGFEPIERSALPASWQAGYQFTRPSKAFHRKVRSVAKEHRE